MVEREEEREREKERGREERRCSHIQTSTCSILSYNFTYTVHEYTCTMS